MSLIALQRDFHAYLVDAPSKLKDEISPSARSGLAIYQNAYRVQLADCLAETFAHTLAWLGGDAFIEAARDHIERTPPTGWTLGAYGEGFAHTLAQLYPNDPEVAELAELEWMLSRAFEGENAEALPTGVIASIDWDNAAPVLVPTLRSCRALTNAAAIWSALAGNDPPPSAATLPMPASMLIWRQGFTPCFRMIDAIEHKAIIAVQEGMTFADLCAMLVDMQGEEPGLILAGQMLGQWFADGLILKVHTKDLPCAL